MLEAIRSQGLVSPGVPEANEAFPHAQHPASHRNEPIMSYDPSELSDPCLLRGDDGEVVGNIECEIDGISVRPRKVNGMLADG